MINDDTLIGYIQKEMPDASVTVIDRTGTRDHFMVQIVSDVFKGKHLLDRHRLVHQALKEPMKDGRIHAIEIKAKTEDELSQS